MMFWKRKKPKPYKPSKERKCPQTLEEMLAALQDAYDEPVTEDVTFARTKSILEDIRKDMPEFYVKIAQIDQLISCAAIIAGNASSERFQKECYAYELHLYERMVYVGRAFYEVVKLVNTEVCCLHQKNFSEMSEKERQNVKCFFDKETALQKALHENMVMMYSVRQQLKMYIKEHYGERDFICVYEKIDTPVHKKGNVE